MILNRFLVTQGVELSACAGCLGRLESGVQGWGSPSLKKIFFLVILITKHYACVVKH